MPASQQPILSPAKRLESLRKRIIKQLSPSATVQVKRTSQVALLRSLSPTELREFAASCHATVVPRLGGTFYDFSHSARY